jgi:hypothetical protein
MPDYQLAKIYKIVCNTSGMVYYGSTCEPTLARRLAKHVACFKFWKNGNGNYVTSYQIFENDNYEIILVEKFACDDKMELLKRERYYIENNECINKTIPLRTKKEYSKQYYENNKDILQSNHKIYRENNKDDINLKKKEYYEKNKIQINEKHVCTCGGKYTLQNKAFHMKTKKHLDYTLINLNAQ